MLKTNKLAVQFIIIIAISITILGCELEFGPTLYDVSNALTAIYSCTNQAASMGIANYDPFDWTYSEKIHNPDGGSLFVAYQASGDPTQEAWSATGTLSLSDWADQTTGYTINGTLSISMSDTAAATDTHQTITGTMTGALAFSGAPISTLECNVSTHITYINAILQPVVISGIVTADGKQFDAASLQ